MKARALQKHLSTERTVHATDTHICVASGCIPDLISLNKATLKLKYAMDTFHEGRAGLKSDELRTIWDALQALVETGDIHNYLNGDDEITAPIPVFYENNGVIVEAITDFIGWPNITNEGILMYENTFFSTREGAIERTKITLASYIERLKDNIRRGEDELSQNKATLIEHESYLRLL